MFWLTSGSSSLVWGGCLWVRPTAPETVRGDAAILRQVSLAAEAGERSKGHSLPSRARQDSGTLGPWLGVRGMVLLGWGQLPCISEELPPLLPCVVPPAIGWLPDVGVSPGFFLAHSPSPQWPPLRAPQNPTVYPPTLSACTAPARPHHGSRLYTLPAHQPVHSPPGFLPEHSSAHAHGDSALPQQDQSFPAHTGASAVVSA